jgi:hypothetical protein
VRENGPRQPRGMVRASSDGAIVNTASSFSFAMEISAGTGPAADVSCDLTLGFKEAGTPSTAAAGSGGGGLGSGSSGNGPRPQQQQLEFFTPMRQPQLLQMVIADLPIQNRLMCHIEARPSRPSLAAGSSPGLFP